MKKYAFWLRMAGALLCILLELYFLAPAAMGIWHVGMLYPLVPLTLLSVWLSCPRLFDRLPRWLCRAGAAVVGAGAAVVLAVMVLMGIQAGHRPTEGDCTVIVLGCQVSRDGSPTVMLDDRIDAAYDYLTAHPESRCVASGGQNDNEPISEASCIRNTLVARGIHPDRIYLEDRSRSTEENLTFSAELIRKEGLPTRVAIASDNFHQLRAAVWARRGGLDPWSIGCVTWWPLSPGYWAREAAAVTVLGAPRWIKTAAALLADDLKTGNLPGDGPQPASPFLPFVIQCTSFPPSPRRSSARHPWTGPGCVFCPPPGRR